MRPPEELLYDSEASLRLVDHAIEELGSSGPDLDRDTREYLEQVMEQPGGFAELSRTLLRAYAETFGIVQRIRERFGMNQMEAGVPDRLQEMFGRLREVATATETATNEILSSVARASAAVERLDSASDAERAQLIASLKDELHGMGTALQFQDITSQQLRHVASVLAETRNGIAEIVTMVATPAPSLTKDEVAGTFDPNAKMPAAAMTGTGDRQALADQIFAITAERKTA